MNDKVRLWGKRVSAVALSIAMVGGSFPTTAIAVPVDNDKGTSLQNDPQLQPESKTPIVVQGLKVNPEGKEYDGTTNVPADKIDRSGLEVFTADGNSTKLDNNVVEIYEAKFDKADVGPRTVTFKLKVASDNAEKYELDEASSETTETSVITKKKVSVQWDGSNEFTYNGAMQHPEATVQGAVAGQELTATVSGGQTNAGEGYEARVTVLSGDTAGNYEIDQDPGICSFKIAPLSLDQATVTLEQGQWTYTGSEIKPAVTDVTVGDVSIPSSDYTVAYDNNIDAGNATVTISSASGNVTDSKSAYFSIAKAQNQLKTKPEAATLTYNGGVQALLSTGAGADFGTVTYAVGDAQPQDNEYSEDIPTKKDAGTYKVWYKVDGTNNYDGLSSDAPIEVTIAPKQLTVTPGVEHKDYDGNVNGTIAITATTFDGLQGEDKFTLNAEAFDGVTFDTADAGERKMVTFTPKQDAVVLTPATEGSKPSNYTVTLVESHEGVINPKAATFAGITALEKTYDGTKTANLDVSNASVGGVIEADQGKVTIDGASTGLFEDENAGKGKKVYFDPAKMTLAGEKAGNYKLSLSGSQKTTTGNINKAIAAVKLTCNSLTYNGSEQELASAVATPTKADILWYVGNDEPKETDWENKVPTAKEAGKYTVWCKVSGLEPNYNPSGIVKGTATIAAAPLTVKADAKSKVEGAADPALTYQVSGLKGSDKSADVVTGTLTRDAGEAPGTYAIKQGSVRTKSANYTLKYEAADFTISAKPLPDTVTVSPVTAHLMNIGDVTYGPDAPFYGTTGESRRVESLQMQLQDQPVAGSIEYRSHVQNQGWETSWAKDGERSGTTKLSRRLEAVAIRLTPGSEMEKNYDVYYRMHVENVGWMGWAKNGQTAGTMGEAKRVEAIQVVLLPKWQSAPPATYKGATRAFARPSRVA